MVDVRRAAFVLLTRMRLCGYFDSAFECAHANHLSGSCRLILRTATLQLKRVIDLNPLFIPLGVMVIMVGDPQEPA